MSTESNTGKATKWPKQLPPLSAEQLHTRDEFMKLWHEILPRRYGAIENFNQRYPVSRMVLRNWRPRTLEIGAGLGGHLNYEDLEKQEYYALELRPAMAEELSRRFPQCHATVGDCQRQLPFDSGFFDRVLAIHVLEHLPNLPAAIREVHRVLRTDGQFVVVIPCEGGFVYRLARNFSARRIFERRFKQPYDWLIESEHINVPGEIIEELCVFFDITHRRFFPFPVPLVDSNLCIGLTLRPKHDTA